MTRREETFEEMVKRRSRKIKRVVLDAASYPYARRAAAAARTPQTPTEVQHRQGDQP